MSHTERSTRYPLPGRIPCRADLDLVGGEVGALEMKNEVVAEPRPCQRWRAEGDRLVLAVVVAVAMSIEASRGVAGDW
jgi:hypothetical protein